MMSQEEDELRRELQQLNRLRESASRQASTGILVKADLDTLVAKVDKELKYDEINRVERNLGNIVRSLANHDVAPGKVREEAFVNLWLPFFAGRIPEEEYPWREGLAAWVKMAGAHTNEMDVIDENGNVLFTCPPIMSSSWLIEKHDERTYSFSSRIQAAYQLGAVRPKEGDYELREALLTRAPDRLIDVKAEYYKRWAEIFVRYGYYEHNGNPNKELGSVATDDHYNQDDSLEVEGWD